MANNKESGKILPPIPFDKKAFGWRRRAPVVIYQPPPPPPTPPTVIQSPPAESPPTEAPPPPVESQPATTSRELKVVYVPVTRQGVLPRLFPRVFGRTQLVPYYYYEEVPTTPATPTKTEPSETLPTPPPLMEESLFLTPEESKRVENLRRAQNYTKEVAENLAERKAENLDLRKTENKRKTEPPPLIKDPLSSPLNPKELQEIEKDKSKEDFIKEFLDDIPSKTFLVPLTPRQLRELKNKQTAQTAAENWPLIMPPFNLSRKQLEEIENIKKEQNRQTVQTIAENWPLITSSIPLTPKQLREIANRQKARTEAENLTLIMSPLQLTPQQSKEIENLRRAQNYAKEVAENLTLPVPLTPPAVPPAPKKPQNEILDRQYQEIKNEIDQRRQRALLAKKNIEEVTKMFETESSKLKSQLLNNYKNDDKLLNFVKDKFDEEKKKLLYKMDTFGFNLDSEISNLNSLDEILQKDKSKVNEIREYLTKGDPSFNKSIANFDKVDKKEFTKNYLENLRLSTQNYISNIGEESPKSTNTPGTSPKTTENPHSPNLTEWRKGKKQKKPKGRKVKNANWQSTGMSLLKFSQMNRLAVGLEEKSIQSGNPNQQQNNNLNQQHNSNPLQEQDPFINERARNIAKYMGYFAPSGNQQQDVQKALELIEKYIKYASQGEANMQQTLAIFRTRKPLLQERINKVYGTAEHEKNKTKEAVWKIAQSIIQTQELQYQRSIEINRNIVKALSRIREELQSGDPARVNKALNNLAYLTQSPINLFANEGAQPVTFNVFITNLATINPNWHSFELFNHTVDRINEAIKQEINEGRLNAIAEGGIPRFDLEEVNPEYHKKWRDQIQSIRIVRQQIGENKEKLEALKQELDFYNKKIEEMIYAVTAHDPSLRKMLLERLNTSNTSSKRESEILALQIASLGKLDQRLELFERKLESEPGELDIVEQRLKEFTRNPSVRGYLSEDYRKRLESVNPREWAAQHANFKLHKIREDIQGTRGRLAFNYPIPSHVDPKTGQFVYKYVDPEGKERVEYLKPDEPFRGPVHPYPIREIVNRGLAPPTPIPPNTPEAIAQRAIDRQRRNLQQQGVGTRHWEAGVIFPQHDKYFNRNFLEEVWERGIVYPPNWPTKEVVTEDGRIIRVPVALGDPPRELLNKNYNLPKIRYGFPPPGVDPHDYYGALFGTLIRLKLMEASGTHPDEIAKALGVGTPQLQRAIGPVNDLAIAIWLAKKKGLGGNTPPTTTNLNAQQQAYISDPNRFYPPQIAASRQQLGGTQIERGVDRGPILPSPFSPPNNAIAINNISPKGREETSNIIPSPLEDNKELLAFDINSLNNKFDLSNKFEPVVYDDPSRGSFTLKAPPNYLNIST